MYSGGKGVALLRYEYYLLRTQRSGKRIKVGISVTFRVRVEVRARVRVRVRVEVKVRVRVGVSVLGGRGVALLRYEYDLLRTQRSG